MNSCCNGLSLSPLGETLKGVCFAGSGFDPPPLVKNVLLKALEVSLECNFKYEKSIILVYLYSFLKFHLLIDVYPFYEFY